MKKLYIYLDETYNLQNKNQFYCFGGFVTSDSEHIKLEYKRLLKSLGLLSKKANKEVKSTDKDALKIREKLFHSSKILGHIDLIGIFQLRESMNFKYYGDTVHKQEQIFYKELFETLLLDILGEYKQEDIELHMILELDKNNKIEREFYENLRKEMIELFNLKVFDIESAGSNNSFGLQLADQITGICREYIKDEKYQDFIDKFKILNVNPLSKN